MTTCRVSTTPLYAGTCVVSAYPGWGVRGDAINGAGTAGASPLFNDLSLPADAAKEFIWKIESAPGVGTLSIREDGKADYTPPPGTVSLQESYTYRLWENGVDKGTTTETIVIGTPTVLAVITGPGGSTGGVSSISIPEGTATVFQFVADSAVTWSISGGADSSQFVIAPNGTLLFTNAPNFEAPADSNLDNAYLVDVRATNAGGNPTTQSVTVNITNVAEGTALAFTGTVPGKSADEDEAFSWANPPLYTYISGGVAPYSYSLQSGTLPTGLSMSASTGVISGTPTVPGTYTVMVRVTDAAANSVDTNLFNITVQAAGTEVTPGSRTLTLPFGLVRAGVSNLKWAFFDQPSADLLLAPVVKGANATINSSGDLILDLTGTTLPANGQGFLVVSNGGGQNDPGNLGFVSVVTVP